MQYNKEELQTIVVYHKLWLSGNKGGQRADLRGADLSNADLFDTDLRHAIFYGADLSRADLRFADLTYADLTNADLNNANLSNTILYGATFDNTIILGKPVNNAPVHLDDLPRYGLITDTMMEIGCQVHSIDEWLAFTVKEINEMDNDAEDFYKKYGKAIQYLASSRRVPKDNHVSW